MYPYEVGEAVTVSNIHYYQTPFAFYEDSLGISAIVYTGGTLKEPLVTYDWPLEDEVTSSLPTYIGGTLTIPPIPLVTYTDWIPEDVTTGLPTYFDGTLRKIMLSYSNWPLRVDSDESVTVASLTFIDGTLT